MRPSRRQMGTNNLSAVGKGGRVPLAVTEATINTSLNPANQYFKLIPLHLH